MKKITESKTIQFVIQGAVRNYVSAFWTERRSRGLARGTVVYYQNELSLFCRYLDEMGIVMLEEVNAEVIRQYLLKLETTRNPGGIHAAFRAVRAFFLWYDDEFEPANYKNPVRKVKPPKVSKQSKPGVSIETVKTLIESCNTEMARRDKLIFLILFDCGLRAAELLALDMGDIDQITGAVTVHMGKGGKSRTVFMGKSTRKALRAYIRELVGEDQKALFVTDDGSRLKYQGLRKIVERRSKAAGIAPPGLHDFRRAFAIAMLREGCDLQRLAGLMGHSGLDVLRRYLHLMTSDLQEVHARFGPVDHTL